jgi:hypothetical protein
MGKNFRFNLYTYSYFQALGILLDWVRSKYLGGHTKLITNIFFKQIFQHYHTIRLILWMSHTDQITSGYTALNLSPIGSFSFY